MSNKEVIFMVEESIEGGYEAKALDHSIYTQADSLEELKTQIKDAVKCHFNADEMPGLKVKYRFNRDSTRP